MWEKLLQICNQRVLQDVSRDQASSVQLLAELMRIDLKNRAEGRQIRNIDIASRVRSGASLTIDEQLAAADKSVSTAAKNRLFGVLPKTLLNVAKAIKAGRQSCDRLVDLALMAV